MQLFLNERYKIIWYVYYLIICSIRYYFVINLLTTLGPQTAPSVLGWLLNFTLIIVVLDIKVVQNTSYITFTLCHTHARAQL